MKVFGRFSVAIVTPFQDTATDSEQSIDLAALEDLLKYICSHLQRARDVYSNEVVGGIIVSGSTGEQHSMSVDERIQLYTSTCAIVRSLGDIPVIIGISATTIRDATRLANAASRLGCNGVMLGLPPYLRLTDPELSLYVESVHNELPPTCPILLYNNSLRNGYSAPMTLIADWYRRSLIWGVKHAAAPHDLWMEQSSTLLSLEPSIRLFTGSDLMAPNLLSNPAYPKYFGLTSIVGNILPFQMAEAIALIVSDDSSNVELGLKRLESLKELIEAVTTGCSLPSGIKYALKSKGKNAGVARLPVTEPSYEKKSQIDLLLQNHSL